MSFFSRLTDRVREVDSLLCIGIDPHPSLVEARQASAVRDWAMTLIESTASAAAAFKPNAAFFEALGPDGWRVLGEIVSAARRHAPVILDVKRGDIESTARAYAESAFRELGADAVTLSPYLGRDSIEPFLVDPERGVFLLCKTSNPGSADLQEARLENGEPFYLRVARQARRWNTKDNLGLVVGATDPAALAAVREAAPSLWILAPGVGAQGGSLEAALGAGLRADGAGLLVPVARGVAGAENPAAEARRLRDAMRRAPGDLAPWRPAPSRSRLAQALVESGCVRFGEFTLKSGSTSPIYLDLRQLASNPTLLRLAVDAYLELLKTLTFDRLAAIPYGALALGGALALEGGISLIYPRLEIKEHGTRQAVEGVFTPGETAVVVDDLVTTGGSKFEAVERLRSAGLKVHDVVVLIDRQSGAGEALAAAGLRLHAVFTLEGLLSQWDATGQVERRWIDRTRQFLARGAG
jgi:uridine monophosphate synthetase